MEWIDVKESLPIKTDYYLCVSKSYRPYQALYSHKKRKFLIDNDETRPTHWISLDEIPLPE